MTVVIDSLDWDQVRVFLAAMRSPSLRHAAVSLGISHPTARRRIDALEDALGLQLFHRRSDGLHPTDQAIELQHAAEEVERAMQSLGRVALAADPRLSGPIRITLPLIVATDLLMDDLHDFSRRWPEIELDIQAGYEVLSLERREADVAIRAMPHGKSPEQNLAGRLAATSFRAVYGRGDAWIGVHGDERDLEWVRQSPFPDLPVRGAMGDPMLQRAACAAGFGLTRLPCYFGDPLLERRTEPEPAFDIWVLVHPELRRNARLRIFRDAIVEAIKRHRPALEGRLDV